MTVAAAACQEKCNYDILQGVCKGLNGPTLLDLRDVYHTSIEVISFATLSSSVGFLVGSFLSESSCALQ